MKNLLLLILIFCVSTPALATTVSYDEIQKKADAHQKELEVEGMSYMIGGGLGLLSSVTLGITSEEVVPKLGYSLMQTLSSAAIAYGGIIYFTGDDITQEALKLKDFSTVINKDTNLKDAQKKKILDDAAQAFSARSEAYRYRVRKIRGILEMTTAAAASSTLFLSKKSGSGSNITLGFILLISLTGGIGDLAHSTPQAQAPVTASVDVNAQGGTQFAVSYHW